MAQDKELPLVTTIVIGAMVITSIAFALVYDNPPLYEDPDATVARIQPVGHVQLADAAAADTSAMSVEDRYNSICAACHTTGVSESPILHDEASWGERMSKGIDGLTESAINGIGIMPARGGSQFSDDEIRELVEYMTNFGG